MSTQTHKEGTCRFHRVGKLMLVPVAGLGIIHIPCALLLIAASIGGATFVTSLVAPGGIAEDHREHIEQILGKDSEAQDSKQSDPHHLHRH